ncbi:LacI family DNA-binding transcriptional regulator [Microbacterium sp. RG1]|uniref:LacI family DNA-binding transcriptional regulator n=1 Tax=Microbacterium sp. RG1 TaxID=2489212 RepID=UPI0010CA5280|nr:LacI family DNA-binding transcriptional regulator [Microbacterium sp. RG1]QCQ17451.1 LacI family DNA-binding transcriptional regulator [Microbacterium sp. RG1]
MNARRATIADVARQAGVAASTASVVFSGKTAVSDATRSRVLAAAAELGYAGPDPRAASLRLGRSGVVGVVIGDRLRAAFRDPVTTIMLDGLAEGVAERGSGLLLLRDDESGGAALPAAPADAFVLIGCSTRLRSDLEVLQRRGVPVVVVEGDAGEGIPRIRLDNRDAQAVIARHVRELGHRRVVVVALPVGGPHGTGWFDPQAASQITVDVTRERLEGALDVFEDAGVYAAGASLIDEGYSAGRAILTAPGPRPTAILAQSDVLAAGIIRAVHDAGLRVPEDVSVTGFDGVSVDGVAPLTLTTMVQPAAEKGRAAGIAVSAMLEGVVPPDILLTSVFRPGNTTGPVSAPVVPGASFAP